MSELGQKERTKKKNKRKRRKRKKGNGENDFDEQAFSSYLTKVRSRCPLLSKQYDYSMNLRLSNKKKKVIYWVKGRRSEWPSQGRNSPMHT
jgi:hypothetical protein